MGARIGSALLLLDGDEMLTDRSDWTGVAPRVMEYLTALGVRDPQEIARLSQQVRLRVESRAARSPLEDSVEAAIEETYALLDEWLVAELRIDGDANALTAARAFVLEGGVPGWSARWAGISDAALAPTIPALNLASVPEFAPLTMQASTIDLCCHRLRRKIAAAICKLFCQPEMLMNPRGDRS